MSTFSLEFPMIGPSVLVGIREEVGLRCKGYAWVPVLWSFNNSRRKGFSPTWFSTFLMTLLMVRDVRGPEWPCFRFQKIWTDWRNP